VANPPRKKGTAYETEVVREIEGSGLQATRTPAGSRYDISVKGGTGRTIDGLATRTDRGQSLVTIRLQDFIHLLTSHGDAAHIECKRYKSFAHHTIFESKFGKEKA
jgi:hypothetical protein